MLEVTHAGAALRRLLAGSMISLVRLRGGASLR